MRPAEILERGKAYYHTDRDIVMFVLSAGDYNSGYQYVTCATLSIANPRAKWSAPHKFNVLVSYLSEYDISEEDRLEIAILKLETI